MTISKNTFKSMTYKYVVIDWINSLVLVILGIFTIRRKELD